jgi:hypothetical protein
MPAPGSSPRPRRRTSVVAADARSVEKAHALVVIDNRPLQRAAWAEFHTARKSLDKATRDLHRHEEVDQPAYDQWLHRTFPTFVTKMRELMTEVSTKSREIQMVIAMGELTGRSLKKLWRERKEWEQNEDDDASTEDDASESQENKNARRSTHSRAYDDFEPMHSAAAKAPASADAKEIYRRLVQRLHPDRGGPWTAARKRLWHEVQQAWAVGDADWLARLELEWETANDVLSPTSPLSRLRRAIEELHGARRDIERKLRAYRGSPPWRFTLSEKKRAALHRRTAENFEHDIAVLQRELDYLNATIAAWEAAPRPQNPSAAGQRASSRARTWRDD